MTKPKGHPFEENQQKIQKKTYTDFHSFDKLYLL